MIILFLKLPIGRTLYPLSFSLCLRGSPHCIELPLLADHRFHHDERETTVGRPIRRSTGIMAQSHELVQGGVQKGAGCEIQAVGGLGGADRRFRIGPNTDVILFAEIQQACLGLTSYSMAI